MKNYPNEGNYDKKQYFNPIAVQNNMLLIEEDESEDIRESQIN
jgi:hypothetical protein